MADSQKHFDVAHPGTTSPQHTSRPIITGRDQLARDPMMKPKDDQPEQASGDFRPQAMLAHEEPKIAPLNPVNINKPTDETLAEEPAEPSLEPAGVKVADSKQHHATEDDQVVEQLIQSRSYELPMQHKKSSSTVLVIVVVLIAIVVAGGIYALSAYTNTL